MEFIIQVAIGATLLLFGLFAGKIAEKKHLKSLDTREAALLTGFLISDLRTCPGAVAPGAVLVTGESVISSDYFKTFVSTLKKIIGGELTTLQTLMTRARREAILRMVESARRQGFDAVCNVRLDTADIGGSGVSAEKVLTMATVLASGTAYRRAPATTTPAPHAAPRGTGS